jgi:hypothetical protein
MIDVEESARGTRATRPDERVKISKIGLDCDEQEQYEEGCRQMYGRKTAEPELNSIARSRSDEKVVVTEIQQKSCRVRNRS